MIRTAIIIAAALLLAGCNPWDRKAGPASTYCQNARPITWVPADTRLTKAQIDLHNRTWKRICAGKK